MNMIMKHLHTVLFFLLLVISAYGQEECSHDHDHSHHEHDASFDFIKNQGQFHENVSFQMGMGGANRLFLEKNGFTYLFFEEEAYHAIHDIRLKGTKEDLRNHVVPGHSYKVNFLEARTKSVTGESKKEHHHNYFLGNDKSRWASEVPIFSRVVHEDLYEKIDLVSYSTDTNFKYDFIIKKGGNPADIKLEYEGVDKINLKFGNLMLHTSVGTSRESKPYAYQIIDGKEIEVPCKYSLTGNVLSYDFPKGYDKEHTLVIDPIVVAATLSGTNSSENFGHTATFDNEGGIYAGGISFGSGYPATTGAFDATFNGGGAYGVDMVVSKYNPNGTALEYATYIGGSGDDEAHSMVVDFNNQLCILGTTDSNNFPTFSNSFQSSKSGGVDITVTKLNASGTALVGSTYLGGSQSDGVNLSQLNIAYGEDNRGEIILDGQGNIYVASVSSSSNFPTTPNAFQGTKSGQQDGVVFKLNSDLSTLFWSTFIGSAGNDTSGGIKVADNGNVIVVGTAGNPNFPMPFGGLVSAWPGGTESAYVVAFSPNGQQVIRGTYWGTSGNDHGYFVDIDEDDNIHVYGTTTGTGLPLTPNTYSSNHGSPQFLMAVNENMTELIYSTTIGTGAYPNSGSNGGGYDFVPIAFMVDKCNNIYFSGYYAVGGLPITSDAIANIPNSFYLGVLEPEATGLSFGTYYGRADHVDGGTSRFDKSGIVYQAVCSCTGAILNTIPGAHAQNQVQRCDIGVFKIDFEEETVTSAFTAIPSSSGCVPYTASFDYTGQDGEAFEWQIEGNVIANSENTNYTFTEAGTYEVMLIAEAGSTCNVRDTSFLTVEILDGGSTKEILSFCPGEDFLFLDASTVNATYQWQDGFTGATYSASEPGIYWVDISIPGCTQRDSFEVFISSDMNLELGEDQFICDDPTYSFDVSDPIAAEYLWSTGDTTPNLTVSQSGNYSVTLTDQYGCSLSDATVLTFQTTPVFSFQDELICEGESVLLDPGLDADYFWSDGSTNTSLEITEAGEYWAILDNGCQYSDTMELSVSNIPFSLDVTGISCATYCDGIIDVSILSGEDISDLSWQWNTGSTSLYLDNLCEGFYELTVSDENGCEFILPVDLQEPDSIFYDVNITDVTCNGDMDGMISIDNIIGGTPPYSYSWNGGTLTDDSFIGSLSGGTYDIIITDVNGCNYEEEAFVYEPPFNSVDAGPDTLITLGDSIQLQAVILNTVGQDIFWDEAQGIWCTDCIRPVVTPVNTTTYTINVFNPATGCILTDEVTIFVDKPRNVFIPNAFSPNEDGYNDLFTIYANQGVEQINYLRIYDRWGELVYVDNNFQPNGFQHGWDGFFKGKKMNPAVFVYVAEVRFKDGFDKLYEGDINLLR